MKTIYEMSATELREVAKERKMPGAWKAKKLEMIAFLEGIGYNAPHELQNEPESTKEVESNNYKAETKEASEPARGLKSYAAWVVDRETKEITTAFGETESREEFYQSIKGKYRVRLITKPEKLEEECKQWEIRHARNKKMKNEKYAHDKEEAKKMDMTVGEYRKWLRESTKSDK